MGEFRAPGTLGEQAPRLSLVVAAGRQSKADARDGLDLEFWRWKIVEEGPGSAPKAAIQRPRRAFFWAASTGSRRIEAGFPCRSRKVYLLGCWANCYCKLQRNAGPRHRQTAWVSLRSRSDKTSGDKPCLGSDSGPDDLRASTPLARARSRGCHSAILPVLLGPRSPSGCGGPGQKWYRTERT